MKFKFFVFAALASVLLFGTLRSEYECPDAAPEAALPYEIESFETVSYDEYITASASTSSDSVVYTELLVERLPYKTEYLAFDTVNLSGAKIIAVDSSGTRFEVDISDIEIKYESFSSLRATDSGVTLVYGGASVFLPLDVLARDYDLSGLSFDDMTLIYDGEVHSIEPRGSVVGIDSIPLEYSVSGSGKNAGKYKVTLSFYTASENYSCPPPITRTLSIVPYALDVVYDGTSFVYDGTKKEPVARVMTLEGVSAYPAVSGGATNAGKYIATASFDDSNYTLKNPSVSFEILKAHIDLSGVFWEGECFEYNGKIRSVTVNNLPDTVILSGYVDAAFSDAGEYVAEAELIYDSKNYNPPAPLIHSWSITPIEYDLTDFGFSDTTCVFDGEIHYPESFGNIPKGYDESLPSYSFSRGATHVSEGEVSVLITFSAGSKNYIAPKDREATVRIIPKRISIGWEGISYVYDGEYHSPRPITSECEVSVDKSYVNAGKYTVCAIPGSEDYEILNPTVSFVINKAANYWLSLPKIDDFYEGSTPRISSHAYFGEAEYRYFSSPDESARVEDLSPGRYYMRACVPESENYLPLYSDYIEFEVMRVAPVRLVVDITAAKLTALAKISPSDVIAYYVNNDGSESVIDFSEVEVIYQSSDKLLKSDNSVTFSAGGFLCTLDIAVERADYDMTGVGWTSTEAVFDGEMKYSYLEGLPEGVTVLEYSFKGAAAAGEYELSATLDYDRANYNEPKLPLASLVIEKRALRLPSIAPAVYDGTEKYPFVEPNDLYTFLVSGGISAGEYLVTFFLTDAENYAFEGGENTASFVIERRPVTLQLTKRGDGYTVSEGSIVEGDSLMEEYYCEDGYVYLRAHNTDYLVTVLPVRERNENAPFLLIFFLTLLILILSVAAYVIARSPGCVLAIGERIRRSFKPKHRQQGRDSIPASAPVSAPLETLLAVDEAYADSIISNSLAKSLITEEEHPSKTSGKRRAVVNIDTVSQVFAAGDTVDINAMKEKGIVPRDARYVKVLARGVIDKPLTVIANDFSLPAVKMIALTGGSAKRVKRVKSGKK